ncbi:hypothetical protein CEXT_161631 [Caerostris extrusa]|uniref:Uncharacterized protein n=1 Tax=Caerostris extrusa TaxID=172846 RepID=A0AAV4MPE1_CAEEX|nr:hypothetical protein CEXT_161631 [Caerostris extrusa]
MGDGGKERFISLARRDKNGLRGGGVWRQRSGFRTIGDSGEELVTRESIQVSNAFCGNGCISRNSNPAQILSFSEGGKGKENDISIQA